MMKKQLCWVLAALLLLTGCASSPAVPSQTETEQATNPPEPIVSALEIPDRFTGDWTGVEGLVTVHADAAVELPDVDALPIATVKRRNFTDEDAERLITFFCGDAPFNQPVYDTKQTAQANIDRYEAIKRGEQEATGDLIDHIRVEGEAYLDKRIADYQKILESAPDENERTPASRKFGPKIYPEYMTHYGSAEEEVVEGFAELPGKSVHISMSNTPVDDPWTTMSIAYVGGYGGYGNITQGLYSVLEDGKAPAKCSLTQEQAVRAGDELMAALGATDMVCAQAKGVMFSTISYDERRRPVVQEDQEGGYELIYTRKVEGLPIMIPLYFATGSEEGATGNWFYEHVTVAVADQGVVWFRWCSPYETPTVTSHVSELLSFQEVTELFAKMIMVTNQDLLKINESNNLTTRRDCKIDRVSLEYTRVRDRDNYEEGTLIPVWNFWGTVTSTTDGHPEWTNTYEHTVQLTVNALDGSIIDLSYGY